VPRSRVSFWAAAIGSTTLSLALVSLVRVGRLTLPGWAAAAAWLTALLLGARLVVRVLRRGAGAALAMESLVALAVPVLGVVALTGGLRSPALVALALVGFTIAMGRPIRARISIAGVALTLVVGSHALMAGRPSVSDIVLAAALLAAASVLAAPIAPLGAVTPTSATGGSRGAGQSQLEPLSSTARTPRDDRGPGGRLDAMLARAEPTRRPDPLLEYLRELRDRWGADEVVLWSRGATEEPLAAASWSTEDADAPRHFASHWLPLVEWSASEQVVHSDSAEPACLAAAPVQGQAVPEGALSISARAGLSVSRAQMKEWMPRAAAHVGRLCDLLAMRHEFARQRAHVRQLDSAAQELQLNRPADELGDALCELALCLTSARRAALVQWDADGGTGVIHAVSSGHWIGVGTPVSEDSRVAEACRESSQYVWEDARFLGAETPVYGAGEASHPVGALAIVPLACRHKAVDVIGAIVLEGDAPDSKLGKDVRNVRVLAAMGVRALDALWHAEEATRRARTDQLTGLANRRHFDERFTQVMREIDRFGGSVALIVADIDLFKRVNDGYGHEAGDAVLKAVAATFADGVRDVDLCARFGGEEIVLLLPHTTLVGAGDLAERLRRTLEQRVIRHAGTEMTVTASFGVAAYPESARSRDAVFPAADRALYKAKAEGRNRVRLAPVMPSTKST
jgi:diguanylate cyclase (GGDEF)-like protein